MLVAEVDARVAPAEDALWPQVHPLSVINLIYAHLSAPQLLQLSMAGPNGVTATNDIDDAVTASDLALKMALLQSAHDAALEQAAAAASEVPASRVVLRVPVDARALAAADSDAAAQLRSKVERLSEVVAGVVLALETSASALETADDESASLFAALQSVRKGLSERAFFAVEWVVAERETFDRALLLPRIAALHHKGIHVVAPALPVVTAESERPRFVDAGRAFVACLRSDRPDGLFTTVVADERGVALGLVYSSAESVLAAIASGRGVYYSRSRQGLWKKGESSGNAQTLVQLDVDCDSDAVRFTVEQTGAGFCHLDTRTCWGPVGGVQHLQSMLASRLQEAPEGSYTKRLFRDPVLLRNKLVEEAQELAEAETVPDVAGEAADVLYFAMVRCVAAGVTLTDIESVLDKRALKVTRRPGNSKAYRIDAAAAILDQKQ
ncbi:hypothetical protein PybrP1_011827 [[Pythium] brassicae (nom. inval.)]|nr:hypothetical protein PybrP1_011827 [[Pythium] brassicae (nom. inval.)]